MEWQPIETAPKDTTPIDIWRPGYGRLPDMQRIEHSPDNIYYAAVHSGYSCVRDATHWMSIPEEPE